MGLENAASDRPLTPIPASEKRAAHARIRFRTSDARSRGLDSSGTWQRPQDMPVPNLQSGYFAEKLPSIRVGPELILLRFPELLCAFRPPTWRPRHKIAE